MFLLARLPMLTAAAALALTGTAFAHAHLKRAEPAENAVVASTPKDLKLFFDEGLEVQLSGVVVRSADHRTVTTGKPELADGDGSEMIVPLEGDLAAGRYTVVWHALSKDGHKTHGSYGFAIKP